MPRMHRLRRSEVDEKTRELYDRIGKARGNVPNMFRVWARRPPILDAMTSHLQVSTTSGTVPVELKELIATLVSKINHCHY